jgi:catechol 2,3-dioxygenase-like lactoylglutathione lyase family enzyme
MRQIHLSPLPLICVAASEDREWLGRWERHLSEGYAKTPNVGQVPIEVSEEQLAGVELYFSADDLPAAITRLEDAGARTLSTLAVRDWGDEAAYFADPDGNVLVVARPAGANP